MTVYVDPAPTTGPRQSRLVLAAAPRNRDTLSYELATLRGSPEFFTRYPRYSVYEWSSPPQLSQYIDEAWQHR